MLHSYRSLHERPVENKPAAPAGNSGVKTWRRICPPKRRIGQIRVWPAYYKPLPPRLYFCLMSTE